MLNKIFLMGRLTRDPEMRHTQNGTAVVSFSIAVDRDFKDKQSGEKVTDFVDIVAWRSTAEFVDKYFSKGRMAVVEGRLQIRDWTDSLLCSAPPNARLRVCECCLRHLHVFSPFSPPVLPSGRCVLLPPARRSRAHLPPALSPCPTPA